MTTSSRFIVEFGRIWMQLSAQDALLRALTLLCTSGWYVDLICPSTEPLIIHKQQSALIYPRRARVSLLTTQNATPWCLFHWPSGGKFLSRKEWAAHAEALVSCPSFIMSCDRRRTGEVFSSENGIWEMSRMISASETDQIQFLQPWTSQIRLKAKL